MRRIIVTLVGTLLTLGGVVAVTAAPASAATHGCVTRHEYKKIKKKMTIKRVKHKVGTNGHRVSKATSAGYGAQIRTYKTCSRWSSIAVSYSKKPHGKWRVDAKSAVWVS